MSERVIKWTVTSWFFSVYYGALASVETLSQTGVKVYINWRKICGLDAGVKSWHLSREISLYYWRVKNRPKSTLNVGLVGISMSKIVDKLLALAETRSLPTFPSGQTLKWSTLSPKMSWSLCRSPKVSAKSAAARAFKGGMTPSGGSTSQVCIQSGSNTRTPRVSQYRARWVKEPKRAGKGGGPRGRCEPHHHELWRPAYDRSLQNPRGYSLHFNNCLYRGNFNYIFFRHHVQVFYQNHEQTYLKCVHRPLYGLKTLVYVTPLRQLGCPLCDFTMFKVQTDCN